MAMSVDEKYQLVTRNLQEVISKEELKKGLNKKYSCCEGLFMKDKHLEKQKNFN